MSSSQVNLPTGSKQSSNSTGKEYPILYIPILAHWSIVSVPGRDFRNLSSPSSMDFRVVSGAQSESRTSVMRSLKLSMLNSPSFDFENKRGWVTGKPKPKTKMNDRVFYWAWKRYFYLLLGSSKQIAIQLPIFFTQTKWESSWICFVIRAISSGFL